jgi:hypothetical protein
VLVVYGSLCEAALLKRYVPHLVLYHVAQTLRRSSGDCGVIKLSLIDDVVALGLFRSRAHVRRLLEEGHGVLWSITGDPIWLHGIERIAHALGARGANMHRQRIGTDALRRSGARRAAFLAATLPVDRPIRQRTIRLHTGVSERTQRRYRASGAFRATRQDADVTTVSGASSAWMRPIWAREFSEHGVYLKGPRLMKRLPNLYTPNGERIRGGRRSKQMFAARPLNVLAEGTWTVPRVYFERTSKWRTCRRLKLGSIDAQAIAQPFNWAYIRAGKGWEAYC